MNKTRTRTRARRKTRRRKVRRRPRRKQRQQQSSQTCPVTLTSVCLLLFLSSRTILTRSKRTRPSYSLRTPRRGQSQRTRQRPRRGRPVTLVLAGRRPNPPPRHPQHHTKPPRNKLGVNPSLTL